MVENTVIGAAICTCQVGADFQLKVFCGTLYKLGELDGETERIVASPNHFSPKRARQRENLKFPRLGMPSVERDICFVLGQ